MSPLADSPVHARGTCKAVQRRLALTLVYGLSCLMLTGCLQGRTVGTTLDDQNTEFRVIDTIQSEESFGSETHIKVEVHQSTVLLLGETDTESKRTRAGELAASVSNVERVVNEIEVGEAAGLATRTHNSWLTTRVNTAIAFSDDLDEIDTGHVKVISSQRTVYLMGLLQREDAEAVTEVVRNVGGVEKVVKVFNYTN